MWIWIKRSIWAFAVATVVYAICVPEVGGKTIAAHLRDIWDAPLTQAKVRVIRHDVRESLRQRLATLRDTSPTGRNPAPAQPLNASDADELDRRALDSLVGRLHQSGSTTDAPRARARGARSE